MPSNPGLVLELVGAGAAFGVTAGLLTNWWAGRRISRAFRELDKRERVRAPGPVGPVWRGRGR